MQILIRLVVLVAIITIVHRGAADTLSSSGQALRDAARELPDVSNPDLADRFVDAALDLQTRRVPAALLTALGWGESRFDAAAGPACGAMQVYPQDLDAPATACAEWRRDLRAGVLAGVREIEMMLADKRVGGNMRRALLYRACGNKAFDGTCAPKKYAWVEAAIARWHAIDARARGIAAGS